MEYLDELGVKAKLEVLANRDDYNLMIETDIKSFYVFPHGAGLTTKEDVRLCIDKELNLNTAQ